MTTKPTMLSYIKEEQATLTAILARYPENIDPVIQAMPKDTRKWLVLGTGSSINAAYSAKYYLEKMAKIKLDIQEPFNFGHYETIDPELEVVFGISQSGQSTSTIDALAKLHSSLTKIAVTSIPTSEITGVTDATLDTLSGKERVGYVTVGFSATVLALMLLGLRIAAVNGMIDAAQEARELAEFQAMTDKFDQTIDATTRFFETHREDFKESPRFTSIAYGPAVGTAMEMETKFSETVRVPSLGVELEAFMHGPYLEINPQHRLFFIDTPAKAEILEKAELLKLYEEKCTEHVFTISLRKDQADSPHELALGIYPDELKAPYWAILPFQVLAWYISKEKGIDLTQRIYTDFSQAVKSKTVVQDYV